MPINPSACASRVFIVLLIMDLPGGSDGKESAWNARDLGLILGLERSSGEGNDSPLQYACLDNPMERETWWVTVHGVTKSDRTEQLTFSLSLYHG